MRMNYKIMIFSNILAKIAAQGQPVASNTVVAEFSIRRRQTEDENLRKMCDHV
jgi:hypothetical protein